MNNATREIKQLVNNARETWSLFLKDKNYNCSIVFEDLENKYDLCIRFKAIRTGSSNINFDLGGVYLTNKILQECDVSQISKLFTTDIGRQHLSRYLLGQEAQLVKD